MRFQTRIRLLGLTTFLALLVGLVLSLLKLMWPSPSLSWATVVIVGAVGIGAGVVLVLNLLSVAYLK